MKNSEIYKVATRKCAGPVTLLLASILLASFVTLSTAYAGGDHSSDKAGTEGGGGSGNLILGEKIDNVEKARAVLEEAKKYVPYVLEMYKERVGYIFEGLNYYGHVEGASLYTKLFNPNKQDFDTYWRTQVQVEPLVDADCFDPQAHLSRVQTIDVSKNQIPNSAFDASADPKTNTICFSLKRLKEKGLYYSPENVRYVVALLSHEFAHLRDADESESEHLQKYLQEENYPTHLLIAISNIRSTIEIMKSTANLIRDLSTVHAKCETIQLLQYLNESEVRNSYWIELMSIRNSIELTGRLDYRLDLLENSICKDSLYREDYDSEFSTQEFITGYEYNSWYSEKYFQKNDGVWKPQAYLLDMKFHYIPSPKTNPEGFASALAYEYDEIKKDLAALKEIIKAAALDLGVDK